MTIIASSIESISQGFKRLLTKTKRQTYVDKFVLAKKNYQYIEGEEQEAQWTKRHISLDSFE